MNDLADAAKTNPIKPNLKGKKMKLHWDSKSYGQRWQAETVFSIIERNLTDSLSSKDYWSQLKELFLLAITHNLLIISFLFQKAFGTRPAHSGNIYCLPIKPLKYIVPFWYPTAF